MEITLNELIKTVLEKMQRDSALTESEKNKILERLKYLISLQEGGNAE